MYRLQYACRDLAFRNPYDQALPKALTINIRLRGLGRPARSRCWSLRAHAIVSACALRCYPRRAQNSSGRAHTHTDSTCDLAPSRLCARAAPCAGRAPHHRASASLLLAHPPPPAWPAVSCHRRNSAGATGCRRVARCSAPRHRLSVRRGANRPSLHRVSVGREGRRAYVTAYLCMALTLERKPLETVCARSSKAPGECERKTAFDFESLPTACIMSKYCVTIIRSSTCPGTRPHGDDTTGGQWQWEPGGHA